MKRYKETKSKVLDTNFQKAMETVNEEDIKEAIMRSMVMTALGFNRWLFRIGAVQHKSDTSYLVKIYDSTRGMNLKVNHSKALSAKTLFEMYMVIGNDSGFLTVEAVKKCLSEMNDPMALSHAPTINEENLKKLIP